MNLRRMIGLWIVLAAAPMYAAGPSVAVRKQIEADWARQEQVTFSREAGSKAAVVAMLKRGALMVADMKNLGMDDATLKQAQTGLDEIKREVAALVAAKSSVPPQWLALYNKGRWAIRTLALKNPRLDFNQILFVRRHWPQRGHQCSHRVGEAQTPGANLCVLTGLSPGGKIKPLLTGDFAEGGIGRPDLSFDGKRVVFPHARKRPKATRYGAGRPGWRGGACLMYDLYEIGVDGKGIRQLTNAPKSEDTEPCYLPGGRIAFTSSRDDYHVQCGDWALVCGIFTMAADGSDIRKVTEPQDGEFYPVVLENGRIMYTRWDYVMKPYNMIQQLWSVNPDGRRAELIYGDWYTFSKGPIAMFEARQIPGTSKVIATGAAHHNTGAGPIMIADLNQNRGGPSGMTRVTPEVEYPEINRDAQHIQSHGWYASPYPLSENHYLCSYSFEAHNREAAGYGLYLMDVHGNKELVYRDPTMSCYAPIPLKARKLPKQIADLVKGVPHNKPGVLYINDVYQGLDGVKRGEAKYLRVLEAHRKTAHTNPQRIDVGVNSGWDCRTVLGTVPIEKDGSAHFQVPPHKLLFFEVLDKDHLEIRRMRNYLNIKPGEANGCVGCHENPSETVANTKAIALSKKAVAITPPPWGAGPMHFRTVVQPVLDKQCIRCHTGEKKKPFDLRGGTWVVAPPGYDADQGPQHKVTTSFMNLLNHVEYIRVGNYEGLTTPLKPYATGSSQSKLMKMLAKGHSKVELTSAEWRALAAWIDCNAPFYGDHSDIRTGKSDLRTKPKSKSKPKAKSKSKPKAISYSRKGMLDKVGWKVVGFDSEEKSDTPARCAIDGDPATKWVAKWRGQPTPHPHWIAIDLGKSQRVAGLSYLPRIDSANGRITKCEIYLSNDGETWGLPVAKATFANMASAPVQEIVRFKPQTARYVKFVSIAAVGGNPWAAVAEIDLLPAKKK
ncbi:MAG: hypothetical protein HN370_01430 [Phycisphaerales bacterium]|nr:hypothetical protein [Phycisphaerales bacterium]